MGNIIKPSVPEKHWKDGILYSALILVDLMFERLFLSWTTHAFLEENIVLASEINIIFLFLRYITVT